MHELQVIMTGASGYLGHYVRRVLESQPGVAVQTLGRRGGGLGGDLRDDLQAGSFEELGRAGSSGGWTSCLREIEKAAVVIHIAAMSKMGACERDPDLADLVNVQATMKLASAARRLIFVSTDLVFDGREPPYLPTARPKPLSVYGATKARAEEALLALGHCEIVRLPLLFGPSFDGTRGATDMLRRAAERDSSSLSLFVDEFRTPLHTADAARVLVDLATASLGPKGGRHPQEHRRPLIQVAGDERVSRYGFGQRFARAQGWGPSSLPFGTGISAGGGGHTARPRDVSMISDVSVGRSLDEALAMS